MRSATVPGFCLALVVTASAVGLVGPARAEPVPPRTDPRQVFLAQCAVCHGNNARGSAAGPSLVGVGRASVDYQLSTGRMPLTRVGRDDDQPGTPLRPLPEKFLGTPSAIPRRHKPAYSPEMISALVDYTVGVAGGGGPDIPTVVGGDLAEGGELFRLQCAACHSWAGDGGALVERRAPRLGQATPTQIAEALRVGPGQMPVFGAAALSDAQVASVVAYVRYLRDPLDRGGNPLWHLGPFAEGALALVALGALMLFTRWIGERG